MSPVRSRSIKARRTAPPPTPPGPVDSDTERRILDAARLVFVRRGSAGARMQEIAAEAGVNQALLHYYFGSKEALANAVFREAASKLFPMLLRILAAPEPLEGRIERVVHHYIDTLRAHPFLPGYVLAEMNFRPERLEELLLSLGGPEGRPLFQGLRQHLQRDLEARARAGDVRALDADQFLVTLISLCVFPFAARPMLKSLLDMDDPAWNQFLDARRHMLPGLILSALRP